MAPDELRDIMRELDCVSHERLGKLIGVTRSTVSLWLASKVMIPLPIAMLLRMLRDDRQTLASINQDLN